jgi:hypothetical protein
MLYILLIIIAVGVLLISEEGKKLLNTFGWLTVILAVLFLVFFTVAGLAMVVSSNLESIKDFVVHLPVLIGLFLLWICIFIIAPKYINNSLKTKNKKTAFWIVFSICLVGLIIYRGYMNYYYPLHTGF